MQPMSVSIAVDISSFGQFKLMLSSFEWLILISLDASLSAQGIMLSVGLSIGKAYAHNNYADH